MSNLKNIEEKAKNHAKAREILNERLVTLEDEKRRMIRKHLKGLRAAAATVARTHNELHTEIDASHDDFQKPRTRVYEGLQVGLRKSNGSVKFNLKQTITAIRRYLPDQESALIKIEEKVVSKAVGTLSADILKKIGVTVIPGSDQVVIKPTDSEINKLIDAWLSDLSEYEVSL
ncbi:MAG: hypothetical protein KZQ76_11820 [Candidatus Thiodiazotropha sp. (ex Epidulcina cf. delphinae)]|nr:hypothetical protein [Candidatus Thiodiazotropha sp. (ex Epidulcina cf. delphinae)]